MEDTAMGMDHRWGKRQLTNVAVDVVALSGKTGTGRVINVSLTGAYLETGVPLGLHSLVYLRSPAQIFVVSDAFHIAANVIRRDEYGVGLEWCETLTRRAQIDSLLALLRDGDVHENISGVSAKRLRPPAELASQSMR
jgi:hypothetical protein